MNNKVKKRFIVPSGRFISYFSHQLPIDVKNDRCKKLLLEDTGEEEFLCGNHCLRGHSSSRGQRHGSKSSFTYVWVIRLAKGMLLLSVFLIV